MSDVTLMLTARDPVVSRDGRPFGSTGGARGNRMRPVAWPLPSVVAGSLRTTLGKAAGKQFSEDTARTLLQTSVWGLFPQLNGTLYLPAPIDCVVVPDKGPVRARPPETDFGSCDWPAEGLRPVVVAEADAPDDFKPDDAPAWWPLDCLAAWLANDPQPPTFRGSFLVLPETEYRTHVEIDPDSGASRENRLFTTAALPLACLPRFGSRLTDPFAERFAPISLVTRVQPHDWAAEAARTLKTLHPLGGERRLVHWEVVNTDPWTCPAAVSAALSRTNQARIRMDLATPAIFRDGWKPGWLGRDLTGTPPCGGPKLKLVGVCIERWRAVSGWSLAALNGDRPGPKAVKRMVPAGGVYFFQVENGAAAGLASCWLKPVSDDDQDQRDGFGLATWGIW